MDDSFNLQRFVDAQAPIYSKVLDELERGQKTGHWMWFVFPQIAGLGSSATAQRYAISSSEEARAYLEHAVLGPRLTECVNALLGLDGRSAEQILGAIDTLKFRSSLTLFLAASGGEKVFEDALDKYFDGVPDLRTLTAIRC
jgi:uncharacterized protein (DUF1810 family)